MDQIKDCIKICLRKNSLSNIGSEKINIVKASGYYKVYHMTDFLFYLSEDEVQNINEYMDKIVRITMMYNDTVKKKATMCILCLTGQDSELIEYIINQLLIVNKMKVLLVCANNNFFQIAYKFNLDYVVSIKPDYRASIQAGLTYLKNSKLNIQDHILVSNTETIIHPGTLNQIINRFSSVFNFAGPTKLSYINSDTNEIFEIKNDNLFLVNWFLIRKSILDKINWGLFEGNLDIYKLLETNITRTNSKILKISTQTSICFNYIFHDKLIKKIKVEYLDGLEYDMLQNYLNNVTSRNTHKIKENIDKINLNHFSNTYKEKNKEIEELVVDIRGLSKGLSKDIEYTNRTVKYHQKPIELNQNNAHQVTILPSNLTGTNTLTIPITTKVTNIINVTKINKTNISKFYFISTILNQTNVINNKVKNLLNNITEQINYTILNTEKDKSKSHLTAIKDASTRKLDKIAIIEDTLINDVIINKITNIEFMDKNHWSLILFCNKNDNIQIYELTENDRQIYNQENKFLAYCLNSNLYRNLIILLENKKNIVDAIYECQKIGGVYIYFDNFTVRKLILNKNNKAISQDAAIMQVNRNIIHIPKPGEVLVPALNVHKPNQTDIYNIPTLSTNIKSIINYNPIKELSTSVSSIGHIRNLLKIPNQTADPVMIQKDISNLPLKKIKKLPPKEVSVSNKIVQGLWIGESLSLNEVMCIMSFIKCGHIFHLYVYEKVKNVPKECIVKDGNLILPESEIFYYSAQQSVSGKRRPTAFSNMFRYKMLYDKGGYWVDMDMICLKQLNFAEPYVFSSENAARGQVTNSGIIKCPKGSEFAKYCYDICKAKDKTKIKWGEIGPALTAQAIQIYGLEQYVKPWYYFCPLGYDKLFDLIKPKLKSIEIQENWYCIHLWNEFWAKHNLDKNKIYYGSLFGQLVNKYCKKYVSNEIFNLEQQYGKYNKCGVLFYWMPFDNALTNEFESMLNKTDQDIKKIYNTESCCIQKELAKANKTEIKNFVETDIYVHLFTKLLEQGVIDNLHIIFGMADSDKYVYNREPLFTNGNYCTFNEKIHLWKLNDTKSFFSFAGAKLYFYKGYGNYEHFYSMLTIMSPTSIFTRYLATAFPYKEKIGVLPIIDDTWIDTYARNDICRRTIMNFDRYLHTHYANYDLVLVNSIEKVPHYKKLFLNAKKFSKFKKFSVMTIKESKRIYDVIFCASDVHPSKNWDVLFKFLSFCENTHKNLTILIVTPIIGGKSLDRYARFKYVHTTIKRGLTSDEMNDIYNQCRTLFVTFGRDANPRVISESLNCGCFNIILDILSDGKDTVQSNPLFGQIIKIPGKNIIYNPEYKSVKCILSTEQHELIYNLIKKDHDHELIAKTFTNTFNADITASELQKDIISIEKVKQRMVVTLATEDYSKSMNYLLSSLHHTNPKLRVLIYYVGWRESLLEQFINYYPDYQFEEIVMPSNYTKGDILKLKVKLQHDTYFKYNLPYIWIDADSVVLKNLGFLFDKVLTHDLTCYHRPDEVDYMKFAVGVIAFNNNNKASEFLKAYYKQCDITKGHNDWFYDQSALWEVFQDSDISLYALKENEHSINDTPNTIIYSRRQHNKLSTMEILAANHIPIMNITFEGIKIKYD